MILGRLKNGQVKVKNYKSFADLGILCGLENIPESELNALDVYYVENTSFDDVLQRRTGWEIVNDKCVPVIINKPFDSLEDEKAKKIKVIQSHYKDEAVDKFFYHMYKRAFEPSYSIPQEVKDEKDALDLVIQSHIDAVNAFDNIKDVISYEGYLYE